VRHGHSADHDNPSRYRIEAMAHTAADVVRNLGGLLFDRRCLGWDTAVLLDDCADIRPLQIIGAECADLKPALDKPEHPRPAAAWHASTRGLSRPTRRREASPTTPSIR
jgi:hypothetical protein